MTEETWERWTIILGTQEILYFYFHFLSPGINTYMWKYLHICTQEFFFFFFSRMLTRTQITHAKQGTTQNPNQTAMSHTVTVATVVGSMQNTFCHISGVSLSLSLSLFAPSRRHSQHSATVIPALISQVDQWIKRCRCTRLTPPGHSSDLYPFKSFTKKRRRRIKEAFIFPLLKRHLSDFLPLTVRWHRWCSLVLRVCHQVFWGG